jgi:hypothetical protein
VGRWLIRGLSKKEINPDKLSKTLCLKKIEKTAVKSD